MFHISGATRDGGTPVEKNDAEKKCKFNESCRRDFAWIAKLPDNGMAQCNVCHFSISSGGRTDVRRHQESARHPNLVKRRALYEGWDEPNNNCL